MQQIESDKNSSAALRELLEKQDQEKTSMAESTELEQKFEESRAEQETKMKELERDDKKVVLGINQKAVLVLAPASKMAASRHRKLRRHHVAMDRKGCFSRGG